MGMGFCSWMALVRKKVGPVAFDDLSMYRWQRFCRILQGHIFSGLWSKMGSAWSLREKERVWRNRSTHWREGRIGLSVIIGLFLEYVIFLSKSFHLYGASLPQVGFALQSGLNVIPCFGEKLEEREAGRTLEVETLTFIFAFCEIMDQVVFLFRIFA